MYLCTHFLSLQSVTESQNVSQVGRDLQRSSGPTPLFKRGHLKHVTWDHVQTGFEYLQSRRLHNLSEQPVAVLCHLNRKEVLPHKAMKPHPRGSVSLAQKSILKPTS